MNKNTEDVFRAWLKLDEDEKREFVKQLLNFNNLPEVKQKIVKKSYEKS